MSAALHSLNKVFRRDYTNGCAWARRSPVEQMEMGESADVSAGLNQVDGSEEMVNTIVPLYGKLGSGF